MPLPSVMHSVLSIWKHLCFDGNMIPILIYLCKPSTLQLFWFCANWEIYISSSLSHIFKSFIVASTSLASFFLTSLSCVSPEQASVTLCITCSNTFYLSCYFKNAVIESHFPVPLFDSGLPIFANLPSAISLDFRHKELHNLCICLSNLAKTLNLIRLLLSFLRKLRISGLSMYCVTRSGCNRVASLCYYL